MLLALCVATFMFMQDLKTPRCKRARIRSSAQIKSYALFQAYAFHLVGVTAISYLLNCYYRSICYHNCMVLARQQLGRLIQTGLRRMSTAAEQRKVEVFFVDPRTILQKSGLKALLQDQKQYTSVKLPESFLPSLSQGQMELGDMDDPMNAWHFGENDEFCKYRLLGSHPTMSGFTSIIEREQLQSLCEEGGDAGLPEWEDFKEDLQSGSITFPSLRVPFLFAGTVLDAPAAAVYQLSRDGQVVGLAVSSEAATD